MSKLTREEIQEEVRTSGHQRLRGENFRGANLFEFDLQDSDLGDSALISLLGRTGGISCLRGS
jgi:hypothetical protein